MEPRELQPESLRAGRILPVVRSRTGEYLDAACEALVEAGLRTIEVTTNTPGVFRVIARLRDSASDVGLGTVRTVEHVRMALDAGASFVVTPTTSLEVGRAALDAGLAWFPGAMTPTEIELAWSSGATAVKVFPAGGLGGPRYLRDVLAPLDDVVLVPTGGIAIDAVADYLSAGAAAVGLGSPLMGDAVETGDVDALVARVRALQQVVQATGEHRL